MGTPFHGYDPAVVLFPKTRRSVLGLLFSHPDTPFYLRRVVEETGLGIGQVQRELKILSDAGVISSREQEGRVYFQADERCPIYEELRGIVRKTMGATAELGRALAPLARDIRVAFVFGSVARGEETSGSDLDLMVVGDVPFTELSEAIRRIEQRVRRDVNLVVYPTEELAAKAGQGHHFILQVLHGKKVFLIGDERELAAVLG